MFEHDDLSVEDVFFNLARRFPAETYEHIRQHYDEHHAGTSPEEREATLLCVCRTLIFAMDGINSMNTAIVRIIAGPDAIPPPTPISEE